MTMPFALIVEDDVKLADILSLTLQAAGFRTEAINDGLNAAARLSASVPDMVVLDLHLPRLSGVELLKQIRADERLARTKVILATADDQLAQTISDQADLVLLKPISPEQLRGLSARLVSQP